MPDITIYTDASYSQKYKCGTYAFIIEHPDYTIKTGGILKAKNIKSPDQAEIMAIANAMNVVATTHLAKIVKCRKITVYTDCLLAIKAINNNYKIPFGKRIKKCVNAAKFRHHVGYVRFLHVKAHTGKQDHDSLQNEWCDKEAKNWMAILLKQKRKQ